MKKIRVRGFSLMELIIVIGLIAILVTATFLMFGKPRADSRNAARLVQIHEIRKALQIYANQNGGYYPAELGDLVPDIISKYPTVSSAGTGQSEPIYIPIGSNLCVSYHLGVALEPGESALNQTARDDDLAPRPSCTGLTDFQGHSTNCSSEVSGDDYCYDIEP
ncbi:MAG: type II secretion system protein [bacterium]|nr:type II secretion system protein [bacterium]